MSIELILADDHPIVLDGLAGLFAAEGDIDVLARCSSGDQALAAVLEHRPAVAVIDLRMPAGDGLSVLRRLAEERVATRVVVLTAGLNEREMIEAARLGAAGIVLKESAPDELVRCVRAVAQGATWRRLPFLPQTFETVDHGAADAELTEREIVIIRLVGDGLRNKEIARRLDITEGTVKVHLHRIYEKLEIDGRLALLRWADDRGLV